MPRRPNVDKAAKPQHALKRKAGRPQHVPDDKSRRRVIAWSGGGIDQKLIAESLHISDPTLRKHYRAELRTGKATMDGLAISALAAAMQRGGKEAVAAAKWWTQARMGWSEKLLVDDGRADQPMRVVIELVGDPPPLAAESTDRQTTRAAFDAARHVQLVG